MESKRTRQYLGIAAAVLAYYIAHEGAHLVYAWMVGAFKSVKFLGVGVRIDVYADRMSNVQMAGFCFAGSVTTRTIGTALVLLRKRICQMGSKVFIACMYYVTIALLLLDPLYLSVLCGFFGGGDMNGIAMVVPEMLARVGYGLTLVAGVYTFWKWVLPTYKEAFAAFQDDPAETLIMENGTV